MDTSAASHPALIWLAIGIAALSMIVNAAPKILGPLGKSLQEWQAARNARHIARDDADLAAKNRVIENLQGLLEEKDADFAAYRATWAEREKRWRHEKAVHDRWDYEAAQALMGHEPPFSIAPAYMTPDPIDGGKND